MCVRAGGAGGAAELLRKFYAVLAERVYAMEDAIRTRERVRLRDVAHRVAGSGSTMGHPELTELGRALELALNVGVLWEQLEPMALRFLTAARGGIEAALDALRRTSGATTADDVALELRRGRGYR